MATNIIGPHKLGMAFILFSLGMMMPVSLNAFNQHNGFHSTSKKPRPEKKSFFKNLREKRVARSVARLAEGKPVRVSTFPAIVRFTDHSNKVLGRGVEENSLNLSDLEFSAIGRLSKIELRNFLLLLAQTEQKIAWEDKAGKIHEIKRKKYCMNNYCFNRSNAAAGLALRLATYAVDREEESKEKLLSSLVASLPEAILPVFLGAPAALLDSERCARILVEMMNNLNQETSANVARAASYLVEMFIKPRAAKDVARITDSLCELLMVTQKIMGNDQHENKEQRIGMALGSILAGFLRYAQRIKDWDEKRLWVTLAVLNVVSAAAGFFGMIPTALLSGAIGGGFAVGAVVGVELYGQRRLPRDFRPNIREVMGQIELEILETTKSSDIAAKYDVLSILSWMHASINVNGLAD